MSEENHQETEKPAATGGDGSIKESAGKIAANRPAATPGYVPGGTKLGPDNVSRDDEGTINLDDQGAPKKKRGRPVGSTKKKTARANTTKKRSRVADPGKAAREAAKEKEQADELKRIEEAEKAAVQMAAQMTATSFFTLNMLISDEFAPIKDATTGQDELLVHTMAWQGYYEAKGIKDIPPGVALAAVLTQYYGSRLAMPKTQQRVGTIAGRLKFWMSEKWKNRKNKKVAKKGADAIVKHINENDPYGEAKPETVN